VSYTPPPGKGAVSSVNGKQGIVVLAAADVGAATTAALTAESVSRVAGDTTLPADTQTASYVLALTDAGETVEMNAAGANTVTVPPHSAVAFPVGAIVEVFQYGAGQTSVVAGAGVTVRSPSSKLKLAAQFSSAVLRQRAQDEWALEGDLTA
jgi:hypothetical protein